MTCNNYIIYFWLVVSTLWKISVSWDDYSQYMENKNVPSKHFQTTNRILYYMYTYTYIYMYVYIYMYKYILGIYSILRHSRVRSLCVCVTHISYMHVVCMHIRVYGCARMHVCTYIRALYIYTHTYTLLWNSGCKFGSMKWCCPLLSIHDFSWSR